MSSTTGVICDLSSWRQSAGSRPLLARPCIGSVLSFVHELTARIVGSGANWLAAKEDEVSAGRHKEPSRMSGMIHERRSKSTYNRVVDATPRFASAAMFPSGIAKAAGVSPATARRYLWEAVDRGAVIAVPQAAYACRFRFHRETAAERERQANDEQERSRRRIRPSRSPRSDGTP
jgi:hypothetical protein